MDWESKRSGRKTRRECFSKCLLSRWAEATVIPISQKLQHSLHPIRQARISARRPPLLSTTPSLRPQSPPLLPTFAAITSLQPLNSLLRPFSTPSLHLTTPPTTLRASHHLSPTRRPSHPWTRRWTINLHRASWQLSSGRSSLHYRFCFLGSRPPLVEEKREKRSEL